MKRLWLDLETTGLDAEKNGIVQIAMIVEEGDDVVERYSSYVRPFRGDAIHAQALRINKIKREDLKTFPLPEQVGTDVIAFLARHTQGRSKLRPCGYNVGFDLSFLEAFAKKISLSSIWQFLIRQTLDPLPVAVFLKEMGIIKTPNAKLGTMCEYYNIDLPGAHDATHDIEATRLLAYKMKEMITQIA